MDAQHPTSGASELRPKSETQAMPGVDLSCLFGDLSFIDNFNN